MKNMKSVLSLLLSAMIMLTLIAPVSLAAETDTGGLKLAAADPSYVSEAPAPADLIREDRDR